AATGAVGGQLALVPLDQVLGLSACAVDGAIERLRVAARDAGDDVTDIQTLAGRLDARHDAAGMGPGFGGVAGLGGVAHGVEDADRAPGAYLVGLGEDQGVQRFVPGQAEDVTDGIFLAPVHGLAPAIVAVTANSDDGVWPVPPDAPHQAAQMGADLLTAGGFAGTQDGDDAMTRGGVVDVDRREATLVVMRVYVEY